jgi:hypothetical protein
MTRKDALQMLAALLSRMRLRPVNRDWSGAWSMARGVGAGYEFTKKLAGRIEFERVRVEFQGEKHDADFVTVGVLYRF